MGKEEINMDKQRLQKIQNEYLQRQINALGYEINITSLTGLIQKVSEQKFFEIAPADYVPIKVGNNPWSTNLVTYRSFNLADDFSTGVINTGGNNARLAQGDAGVDSVTVKVLNWAKSIGWSIMDLQFAAKSGNWDLVTAKEKSRKKNWDLGIQKIAFLGLTGDSNFLGLLNQPGVTVDTTTLTGPISQLSVTNLSAFIGAMLNVYRINCNYSAWPTHFVIPESDFLALATPSSPTYPIKSILELMLETLRIMTNNPNFKVLPCRYGDKAVSGLSKQVYALYNYDEESIRMDIPVDYTNTLANSIDNFSFQNVGYGQTSGIGLYRSLELYYFQY